VVATRLLPLQLSNQGCLAVSCARAKMPECRLSVGMWLKSGGFPRRVDAETCSVWRRSGMVVDIAERVMELAALGTV
jgi:hypothetical protein